MKRTHHKQVGFTLIELLIVVIIIALLAAVAIPGYRQFIKRNNEEKAKSLMLNYAIQLEKWRAKTLSYAGFAPNALRESGDLETDGLTINYPAGSTGTNIIYTITINAVTGEENVTFSPLNTSTVANRWVMVATPQNNKYGMVSMGLTSTGIKCQNTTNITPTDAWSPTGNCGTGGTTW